MHPYKHSMVKSRPLQFGVVGGMGVKKMFVWLHPFAETCTWDTVFFCEFPTKFMFLMRLKLPRGAWSRLGLVVVDGHELFSEILRATCYVGQHCMKGRIHENPSQLHFSTSWVLWRSLSNFMFSKKWLIIMHFKILVNKKTNSTTNLACIWRGCIRAIALARYLLDIM